MTKPGSVIDVFVQGVPTFTTPLTDDGGGSYSAQLSFAVPLNITSQNQVVKLEATSGLEVYASIFGTDPYTMFFNMGFHRDGDQLYTNSAALSNSVETEYQRIPLALTWADFPAQGQYVYTLEISATVIGPVLDQLPSIQPIAFVVTHIELT